MAGSNFDFVAQLWPQLLHDCRQAELGARTNPRGSAFQTRYVLEQVVSHISEYLGIPASQNIFDALNHPEFKRAVNQTQLDKMHRIRKAANSAVHSSRSVDPQVTFRLVQHLWDVLVFAGNHFSGKQLPRISPFNLSILSAAPAQAAQNQQQLLALQRKHQQAARQNKQQQLLLDRANQQVLEEKKRSAAEAHKLAQAQQDSAALQDDLKAKEKELEELREQLRQQTIEAQRQINPSVTPPLALNEEETRRDIITPMLEEAGFVEGKNLSSEYTIGALRIDYVLWGPDGQPLAVVEAKRASRSIEDGRNQAAAYADALGEKFGITPLIFYTTGHDVRFWDRDAHLPGGGGYNERQVEAYPTAEHMMALIRRRTTRLDLRRTEPNDIASRPYQLQMISAVAQRFSEGHRRGLLVMATGTGKTRVAISTAKRFMQAGWARNILFLADRTALVNQAHAAFTQHLPEANPVNLIKNRDGEGQVYVCTYQTMIDMIGPNSRFSAFDFDMIIVDEAHRSIYQRYSRIFDYLDAYVLGLTATPRSNLDHNTYNFFGCAPNEPTGYYGLTEAIDDGNLVQYQIFQGETLFLRQGIKYDDLTEEQKIEWEQKEWGQDEDGVDLDPPSEVSSGEINRLLFNVDTIRKVLLQVVEKGIKVSGAEKLGKTIIFARSQQHARLIAEELRALLPPSSGMGCEVITHGVHDAEGLINKFKDPQSGLDIAISVDMLDTGVDVPEVVNLVFFKPVYSPTKFWQMIGRGTRLCPDLLGPGQDKQFFYVFDYCDNIGQFDGAGKFSDTDGARQQSLSERGFRLRVRQLQHLDGEQRTERVQSLVADLLGVPEDSVLVPRRSLLTLRKYQKESAWEHLSADESERILDSLSQLPFGSKGQEEEQAKRFDILVYRLQLGIFEEDAQFAANQEKVVRIAQYLLTKTNVTAIAAHAELLEAITIPEWWLDISYQELECARRELRNLVRFVDKGHRAIVVTNFEDEIGELEQGTLTPTGGTQIEESVTTERLRQMLEGNTTSLPLKKLREGRQLTITDVEQLEELIAGLDVPGVEKLRQPNQSIGRFLRGVVGMDADAVYAAFADLLQKNDLGAEQIHVLNMLVRHFINQGIVEPHELAGPPFNQYGAVVDLFPEQETLLEISGRVQQLNTAAEASETGA